jgi:hypothetical protein
MILNLLEYFDIGEPNLCCSCVTTASISGVFSGALVILSDITNIPLLWFLCRRHKLEVYISHFMEVFTGEKTKSPRRGLQLISRKPSLLSKKR